MNVSDATNTTYISQTDKQTSRLKSKDDESLYSPIHHTVRALDEKANEILDTLLAGMSKKDQTSRKLWLDFILNSKVSSNGWSHTIDNNASTSKEAVIDKIDKQIANLSSPGQPDMLNLLPLLEELKKLYLESDTPKIKDKEDSVVDKFLDDLYSADSIASASVLVKEDMQNNIDEYAKTLGDELSDTEKSKMLNNYKQELLQGHKEVLEALNDETPSLKQQGIMKALLEENSQEESSLALLLAQKIDSTQNGANYYMKNLDEKGNKIVDNILSERTDTEQFAIKAIMDRGLNFENTRAYSMAVDAFNEYQNKSDVDISTMLEVSLERNNEFLFKDYELKNTEDYIGALDSFIERSQKGVDKYGIIEVAEQLKSEYLSISSTT